MTHRASLEDYIAAWAKLFARSPAEIEAERRRALAPSMTGTRKAPRTTQPASVRPEQDMTTCATCLHFLPDTAQGVGTCRVTGPSGGNGYKACYPLAPQFTEGTDS